MSAACSPMMAGSSPVLPVSSPFESKPNVTPPSSSSPADPSPSSSSPCTSAAPEPSSSSSIPEVEMAIPSTSQDSYPAEQHRSPALARSVPSSHEATSPPEAAGGNIPQPQRFYYFTTDMANQAMEDIEREKDRFDTLLKWYRCRKEEEVASLGTSRGHSTASSAESSGEPKENSTPLNGFQYSPHLQPGLGDGGPGSVGPRIGNEEQVELEDISPSILEFLGTEQKPLLKRKLEESGESSEVKQIKLEELEGPSDQNPLRKLEMMSAAQHFNNANTINDVVESSSTARKDERAAKLEKLDGINKSIEDEMRGLEAAKKMAAGQNFPSPGQYPMHPYPGAPGMPGMPGPYSTGTFPPGPYPGPYGYPFTPGMPGYPMSAPGKMPFQSPSFGGPMPPGAMPPHGRMPMHPGMMHPQHAQMHYAQMHAQHMAQMAKAGAMSPGGSMMPGGARHSPIQSPFPPGHPAHHNPAAYHHMMMMRNAGMPPGASPFGYPGPSPMMGGPPMHPGMMNPAANPALAHQNSMLMLARDGSSGGMSTGWHPQLTPHYPPSFPGSSVTPVPSATRGSSTPSSAATPSK